ncbi:MAG TPA: hypothetical protein VGB39_03255 [Sphingomicrobium sp.]
MKAAPVLLALLVAALTGSSSAGAARPAPAINPMDPSVWEIGPVIGARNYSVNMPPSPSAHPAGGWYFDIPYPNAEAGHVHYVTFKHGSLYGKSRIVMRYRLEMGEGVRLVPAKEPATTHYQPLLTMYLQRRGDDWSGTGKYEAYRWWATFATVTPIPRALPTGEHELSVPLDGRWTAVQTSTATTNPNGFRAALRDTERVGFTFGGGDGYGHGVYATGPARFVVTHFAIVSDTNFSARSAP